MKIINLLEADKKILNEGITFKPHDMWAALYALRNGTVIKLRPKISRHKGKIDVNVNADVSWSDLSKTAIKLCSKGSRFNSLKAELVSPSRILATVTSDGLEFTRKYLKQIDLSDNSLDRDVNYIEIISINKQQTIKGLLSDLQNEDDFDFVHQQVSELQRLYSWPELATIDRSLSKHED